MKITERFLRAKHWHLFLLTFGMFTLFSAFMIGYTIVHASEPGLEHETAARYIQVLPFITIILLVTFFGWVWSVATSLQSKIPTDIRMKTGWFKLLYFIPFAYMVLICIVLIWMIVTGISDVADEGPPADPENADHFFLSINLLAMIGMLYCFYFVAKTIKTVELQRKTSFSDFAGTFFLIVFYPLGIWILQPKINQMIDMTLPVDGAVDATKYLSEDV